MYLEEALTDTHRAATDQATFDGRFATVRERLLRICIGLVGRDDAEDVVHDVYVRARARRRQLRDIDLFDAWICHAAVNLCFNHHRRLRRSGGSMMLTERGGAQQERDVGLRELIEDLPARERTVVVLHYGHGYRLDEIARLLSLSPVNARTIVFRARQRLGEELRKADR